MTLPLGWEGPWLIDFESRKSSEILIPFRIVLIPFRYICSDSYLGFHFGDASCDHSELVLSHGDAAAVIFKQCAANFRFWIVKINQGCQLVYQMDNLNCFSH